MPYRKRYNKKYPKKTFARRRKRYVPRNRFSTSSVMPKTMKVNLKYFDQVSLNPVTGSQTNGYVMRANDIFDPDVQLGGHQPMGFDQYMALYTRFRVVGAKISCTFVANDSTSLNSSALCGILKSTSSSFSGTVNTTIENDKCVYRVIQLGDTSRPLTLKYSTKKSQGIKNIMDNYELSGTVIGSPAIQDYFHVWTGNVNPSNDAEPVDIQIHISYSVIFSDPVQLLGS